MNKIDLISKILIKPFAFTTFIASVMFAAKPAQAFDLVFEQISPNAITYNATVDFNVAANPTVLGNITGTLSNIANVGCNASDFSSFTAGNIALILRGTCTFALKVTNAQNAGAIGVVMYNNVTGLFSPSLANSTSITIPTIAVTQNLGQTLFSTSNPIVHIQVAESTPVPFEFNSTMGLGVFALGFGALRKLRKGQSLIGNR